MGPYISSNRYRHTRVCHDDAENVVVEFTFLEEFDAGELQAFLKHIGGIGAIGAAPADIDPVGLDDRVADQFAIAQENRRNHGRILGVGAGAVGLVVKQNVAVLQARFAANGLDRFVYAKTQRPHE